MAKVYAKIFDISNPIPTKPKLKCVKGKLRTVNNKKVTIVGISEGESVVILPFESYELLRQLAAMAGMA